MRLHNSTLADNAACAELKAIAEGAWSISTTRKALNPQG
jgi:hypothetical protein